MYKELFNGYNCLSAAIGEYCGRKQIAQVQELINSQYTFLFDEDLFWKNEWFAGSTLEPVDKFLVSDLEQFGLGHITEKIITIDDEKLYILQEQLLVVLVDFFYMDSVDWKMMKRFNIYPEHDPHFIIVSSINQNLGTVHVIDPYYNFEGDMLLDTYRKARTGNTRQGEIKGRAYIFEQQNQTDIDMEYMFLYRLKRFNENRMFDSIFKMGEAFDKRRLIYGINQDRKWAIDAYNCLRSALDQHENIKEFIKRHDIEFYKQFSELANDWGNMRKKLIEYYNYRLHDLEEISYLVHKLAQKEKYLVTEILS